MSELDALLAEAREADPGDRIDLRDPIVAHAEVAIDAMTDWVGYPLLAAFAIRVLERIGRETAQRATVVRRSDIRTRVGSTRRQPRSKHRASGMELAGRDQRTRRDAPRGAWLTSTAYAEHSSMESRS